MKFPGKASAHAFLSSVLEFLLYYKDCSWKQEEEEKYLNRVVVLQLLWCNCENSERYEAITDKVFPKEISHVNITAQAVDQTSSETPCTAAVQKGEQKLEQVQQRGMKSVLQEEMKSLTQEARLVKEWLIFIN